MVEGNILYIYNLNLGDITFFPLIFLSSAILGFDIYPLASRVVTNSLFQSVLSKVTLFLFKIMSSYLSPNKVKISSMSFLS